MDSPDFHMYYIFELVEKHYKYIEDASSNYVSLGAAYKEALLEN